MFEADSPTLEDDTIDIDRLVIDFQEDAGEWSADAVAAQVIRQLRQIVEEF